MPSEAAHIGGTTVLVTDLGIRYALSNAEVSRALGISGAGSVPMPAGLVELLPEGPALDPQAARRIWNPQVGD
jgi:hypothetical protein